MKTQHHSGKCEDGNGGPEGITEMSTSELSEKTKVPLGLVAATIVAFIGGALWINNSLNQIRSELALIKFGVNNTLSSRDMELWIMKLRLENPELKVPELIK